MRNTITDLHGSTFKVGPYSVSPILEPEFIRGGRLVLTRDTINNDSFILVKRPDGSRGFVFYSNYIYVYGELTILKYEPNKDIRWQKE